MVSIIALLSSVTILGGVKNMSSKVLNLYRMDACLSRSNLINSGEALSYY